MTVTKGGSRTRKIFLDDHAARELSPARSLSIYGVRTKKFVEKLYNYHVRLPKIYK